MPLWLTQVLSALIRLLAGPVAARQMGRLEEQDATARRLGDDKDVQLQIASRPDRGRDGLLDRMRRRIL